MGEIVVRFQMGIYSNYRLVLRNLNDLLCKVYSAFTGSVGNLGATEDGEYVSIKSINSSIFSCSCFTATSRRDWRRCFNPFMRLMFGESYLFPMRIVLVLIVQFYVSGMRQINLQFREAMGLFWHDRYKAVAEAIINLVTSLILVQRHGVTGVFLGTIISTMTTCFWVEPYVLMKCRHQNGLAKQTENLFCGLWPPDGNGACRRFDGTWAFCKTYRYSYDVYFKGRWVYNGLWRAGSGCIWKNG